MKRSASLVSIASSEGNAMSRGQSRESICFGEDECVVYRKDTFREAMSAQDHMTYAKKLDSFFPGALPEADFIHQASKLLHQLDFNPENTINLVSNCRDEICRTFVETLDSDWGMSFNISSLAGMVFCGKTGFKAAMAHSPIVDGKERYVIWVAPHIAIPLNGEEGKVYRSGRENASTACGALLGLLAEIKAGKLNVELNTDDLEQSMLKSKIVALLSYGHSPNLVEITYAAHKAILEDVIKTAGLAVDLNKSEFVIVSGIQVHGPNGQNYFWPGSFTHHTNEGTVDMFDAFHQQVCEWRLHAGGSALSHLQDDEEVILLAAHAGKLDELKKNTNSIAQVHDHVGRNVLHIAAKQGHDAVVDFLLSNISKWPGILKAVDHDERNALEYAVEKGHDECATMIAAQGQTLGGPWLNNMLVKAVQECNVEMAKRLFLYAGDKHAVTTAVDTEGQSLVEILQQCSNPRKAAMGLQLKKMGYNIKVARVNKSGDDNQVESNTNTYTDTKASTITKGSTNTKSDFKNEGANVSTFTPASQPKYSNDSERTFTLSKAELIEILKASNYVRDSVEHPVDLPRTNVSKHNGHSNQSSQSSTGVWSVLVLLLLCFVVGYAAFTALGPAALMQLTNGIHTASSQTSQPVQPSEPAARQQPQQQHEEPVAKTWAPTPSPVETQQSESQNTNGAEAINASATEEKGEAASSATELPTALPTDSEECQCPVVPLNATLQIEELKSQIKAYQEQEEMVTQTRTVLKQQLKTSLAHLDTESGIMVKLSPNMKANLALRHLTGKGPKPQEA